MSNPRGAALVCTACIVLAAGCNRGGGDPPVAPTPDARPIGATTPEAGAKIPDPHTTPPVASRAPAEHRAQAQACDRSVPPPGRPDPKAMGCKSDAECTDGKNGRCVFHPGSHAAPHNACEASSCFVDDDCTASGKKVCRCTARGGQRSECLAGNCRIDADCGRGANAFCSPSTGVDSMGACGGTSAYYCRTAKDTCVEDADCNDPSKSCAFQPLLGHWACVANRSCPVG